MYVLPYCDGADMRWFLYWEWNIVYVLSYSDGAGMRCPLCMEQVSGTMHSRGELAAGASVSAGL